jgi:aspartate/methionine/tyrosine aminotransferase
VPLDERDGWRLDLDEVRRALDREGVLLLPASVFASRLAAVPADRFRIGFGRRDPEPALEAFERFLLAGG